MIPCPACKTELDPKTDRSPRDGRFVCWRCGVTVAEQPTFPATPALDSLLKKTQEGIMIGYLLTSPAQSSLCNVCNVCYDKPANSICIGLCEDCARGIGRAY
jgi:hypothetical protein